MSFRGSTRAAVEQAIRLKEQKIVTEIVAATVGPAAAQEQLRTALAMGADRAIHVVTDEHTLPLHVAKVLKALVQREEPQMVILGKQAQPSAAPPPHPTPSLARHPCARGTGDRRRLQPNGADACRAP